MKNIDTRIKKLEDVVKPNKPHVLLAFSEVEADEKVREYKETHPGSVEPMVIIITFVASPARQEG
jgi:hypothetical protein